MRQVCEWQKRTTHTHLWHVSSCASRLQWQSSVTQPSMTCLFYEVKWEEITWEKFYHYYNLHSKSIYSHSLPVAQAMNHHTRRWLTSQHITLTSKSISNILFLKECILLKHPNLQIFTFAWVDTFVSTFDLVTLFVICDYHTSWQMVSPLLLRIESEKESVR